VLSLESQNPKPIGMSDAAIRTHDDANPSTLSRLRPAKPGFIIGGARRGWEHERASKQVRSEEFICWICGEPAIRPARLQLPLLDPEVERSLRVLTPDELAKSGRWLRRVAP